MRPGSLRRIEFYRRQAMQSSPLFDDIPQPMRPYSIPLLPQGTSLAQRLEAESPGSKLQDLERDVAATLRRSPGLTPLQLSELLETSPQAIGNVVRHSPRLAKDGAAVVLIQEREDAF